MLRYRVVFAVCVALLAAACAAIPRAELTAYTSAYTDVLTVTNGVLDIVAPYERIVIRSSATTGVTVPRSRRGQIPEDVMIVAEAQLRGDPSPPAGAGTRTAQARDDPSLMAPPRRPRTKSEPGSVTPKSTQTKDDPSLFAPVRPATQAKDDPSLLAPVRPATPVKDDPTLFAPARPIVQAQAVPTFVPPPCRRSVGGADPFCYEMRDGYADIGDPPLVGAYRNLANVVLRFNGLLIAYADGVSGRLLQQELAGLASSVTELSKISPVANINGAAAFAGSFGALVNGLMPITAFAGRYIDRAELRRFLLENYDIVDQAIAIMARNSVELYGNVAVGTNLFERAGVAGTGQPLRARRKEIRRLIANWTVLLDDVRRLLRDLRIAIANSDGLETRLHTVDGAIITKIDTSAVKKQISSLGGPSLGP